MKAVVADDDTWTPGKIRCCCDILQNHPQKEDPGVVVVVVVGDDDDPEGNNRSMMRMTRSCRGVVGVGAAGACGVQSQDLPYVDRRDHRQGSRGDFYYRDIPGDACFPFEPYSTCCVPVPSRAPFSREGVSCCCCCC